MLFRSAAPQKVVVMSFLNIGRGIISSDLLQTQNPPSKKAPANFPREVKKPTSSLKMVKTKQTDETAASATAASGTTQLPLSRVKKIIAIDPELAACSNPGAFLIAQATELFIAHLASSAHTVVRSERKLRKVIQYKDLAAAVARNENLEFLSDVVPQTVPFKEAKAMKGRKTANGAEKEEKGGRQTRIGKTFEVVIEQKNDAELNGKGNGNGNGRQQTEESEDADPEAQLQQESRRTARLSLTSESGILNGNEDKDGDVQMR